MDNSFRILYFGSISDKFNSNIYIFATGIERKLNFNKLTGNDVCVDVE